MRSKIGYGMWLGAVMTVWIVMAVGCEERKPRLSAFCDTDTPCPSSEQCLNGTCFPTCNKNEDCDGTTICYQGVCVQPCDPSFVCPAEPETICVDGACYPADPPGIVDGGGPQTVNEQEEVILNADNSIAYEPETVVFEWNFIASNPKGIVVQPEIVETKADSVIAPQVRFVAPNVVQDTTLMFELAMRDSSGREKKDSVEITILNTINEVPEVAISGEPTGNPLPGETIELAADADDPNPGTVLTFVWTATSEPEGTELEIVDTSETQDMSSVSFIVPEVPVDTTFLVTVTVSDGTDSQTASISFVVKASGCSAEQLAACDDGNVCTDDGCDLETGCFYNAADGVPCDDLDACTVADSCVDMVCVSGGALDCDDLNICTIDSCDATTGCVNDPSDGLGCDDSDPCTVDDQCLGGLCSGLPLCEDGNPCTDDICVGPDQCDFPPRIVGYPCGEAAMCNVVGQCMTFMQEQVSSGEFGNYSTAMLLDSNFSGGWVTAAGYLQPPGDVPGVPTLYEYGIIAGFYVGDGAWIEHMRIHPLLAIEDYIAVGRYGAVTVAGEGWYDSDSIGWVSSDHDLLSISSGFLGDSDSETTGSSLYLAGTGYGSEGVIGKMVLCASNYDVCDYAYIDGPAAPIQETLLGNHVEFGKDGVTFTVPYAFGFAGVSEQGDAPRIYGHAKVDQDIMAYQTGVEFPKWSSEPPLGCDAAKAGSPCAGVTEWFDVHKTNEVDVWVSADHGKLLHFDGEWQEVPLGGLPDWLDPKMLTLRSVFATKDAVWVIADGPGCGTVECPADPTYRSVFLLHLDMQSSTWVPAVKIMTRQCFDDGVLSCDQQLELFGVEDIVMNEWMDMVLAGADLEKNEETGTARGTMSFWHIYLGDPPAAQ